MTDTGRRWLIRLSAILWFVGCVGFLLAVPVVLRVWIFALPLIVILAALVALPIAWLWRRFRSAGSFHHAWIKTGAVITMALSILLAAPVYYFAIVTQLTPALVPQVTLTNGEKRIVFQGMQHVGAERFYKGVAFDLEDALSQGYVLYYEGVRSSTPAIDQWFDQTVAHGHDLTAMYRGLGDLCGLRFQNDYLQVIMRDSRAHPEMHIVADVSTADLKREYDRLMATDPVFAKAMASQPAVPNTDNMEAVIARLKSGTQGQREVAGILCRGFMTSAMRRNSDVSHRDDLDPLILDYRNRVLAQRLLAEPRQRIFLTYGDKHLPGVFALLKQADPRWHVVSVKWLRTIDSPENYDARLPGIPGS